MLMKYKDFKIMSQNEMKAIKGGDASSKEVIRAECRYNVGEWSYSSPVYYATCWHDIGVYCQINDGYCWTLPPM